MLEVRMGTEGGVVPTSAHTGDGMGDLISLLVTFSQKVLAPKLMLSQEVEVVVLEVRMETEGRREGGREGRGGREGEVGRREGGFYPRGRRVLS